MANTIFSFNRSQITSNQDNLEVYVDLDTSSQFNFNVLPEQCYISELISQLEIDSNLSNLTLFVYDKDNNITQLNINGYDLLRYDLTYDNLSKISSNMFGESDKDQIIDSIFETIISSYGYNYTEQTRNNLSSIISYNTDFILNKKNIEIQPWKYKVSKLVNVNAVKNSIKQIFTWIPGERILNPEFGSMLKKYLYEPITEDNQERIVAEIKQCALRWEPRIIIDRVVRITDINDIENNTIKLDIYYRIKGLNNQQFMYQYEFNRFENI